MCLEAGIVRLFLVVTYLGDVNFEMRRDVSRERKRVRREEVGGLGVVWGKECWEYCQDRSAFQILKEGYIGALLVVQTVKNLPGMQETPIRSLG